MSKNPLLNRHPDSTIEVLHHEKHINYELTSINIVSLIRSPDQVQIMNRMVRNALEAASGKNFYLITRLGEGIDPFLVSLEKKSATASIFETSPREALNWKAELLIIDVNQRQNLDEELESTKAAQNGYGLVLADKYEAMDNDEYIFSIIKVILRFKAKPIIVCADIEKGKRILQYIIDLQNSESVESNSRDYEM